MRFFGIDAEQFAASYDTFLEHIHPEDVARVTAAVEYSLAQPDSTYNIDHRIVRPDGEIRYVEEHGEVYRDGVGLPVRMIGVVHDITDNTLAQLELHREKDRTERYLQISQAMIVELDTVGTVIRINQRGCELLGYQMAELRGCNWFEYVIPASDRTQLKQQFTQLMQQARLGTNSDSSSYCENELLCRNGELITIAWHNTINFDERGHACGTLNSGQDITHRKHIERLKDEFISTVSHELRTPLTSIHGSLRLILGHAFGELPEKVLDLLQVANNNSERLLTLINDLLDIQKIEAGMMQFNFAPTSPAALLQEAVENNHPYALQHKVAITLNIVEENLPAQIEADHDRMMQVMNNLISNAIKFSPSGETVEVRLRGGAAQLLIEVNDHGSGIPEQHRERLFDKFTQVDSSDTRQQGGTGLGLSIANMIVQQHQGTLSYHDNHGGGSSFCVTLPLHITSQHEAHDS
jgi:PAS domain S-box-containing protein